ncbi:SNF2-related protein [Brucella abortus]|uniref:SNF2-related protein n=1 Tax=Brucella abortus TaxID=235 RepID=UPI00163CABDA|nr:SNF2-related protein [Brucella abortus]
MTAIAAILADFKTPPYIHQLREFEVSAELPARALLWQMRTGKTKLTIDTACHLARSRLIDAVIVLAPNGVHENWIRRELPIHHWDTVERDTLAWRTSIAGSKGEGRVPAHDRRGWREQHEAFWARAERLLKGQRLAWFSFASETMIRKDVRNLIARVMRRKKRVMLVVDESDDFGKPGSKKTQMARALARRCAYRRILSGTVVENSPLRAYGQYELLEEGALGFETYADFKDRYAEYERKTNRAGQSYPTLREYKNLDELRERMARLSSVVLREDCEDLPDLVRIARPVELTDEQRQLYRELQRSFLVELDGQEVSVGENTAKLVKLQQVVSGFLIDEYGDLRDVPGGNPRLEALVDEAEMTGGRNVVWCAFRQDMDRVAEALRARGRKVLEYHGRSTDEEKARVRREFAPGSGSDVDDLVGHPKSGGRGLDLSGADKIIWYSHTFDAVVRSQADERATAVGGGNVPVVDLVAPGVDEYILETVSTRPTSPTTWRGRACRRSSGGSEYEQG